MWRAPASLVRPIAVEATVGTKAVYIDYVSPENLSKMQGKDTGATSPYAFTRVGNELRGSTRFPKRPIRRCCISTGDCPSQRLTTRATGYEDFLNVYQAGALYYAYRDMPDIEKAGLMKASLKKRCNWS